MNKVKKMRIAMVGHKRVPSREGGIEVVVEELSTRLVANGHEVTCYNRRGKHVSGKEITNFNNHIREYKGVKIKRVLTIDIKGLAALTSSVFASIKASFGKYDIVHFHAEGPAFVCWIPKLFNKKVVVTVHGLDHMRQKWGKLASAYILKGERNAVKYADSIIVLSTGVKDYFLKTYNRDTIFIPNGVSKPEKRGAKEITSKYGLEKDNYILYLGRLVPEKGINYLVKAFKQINTDKKLVLAGGSSDTNAYIHELAKLTKDDDRIIYTGFVQDTVLQELYSNAYIYVLPSDLEGMPLTLLEAMSYENCCVTSDIRECTDVVEKFGISFKKGDVNDLKNKLQTLCDKPEIVEKYRSGSASYILHKYSWDNCFKDTEKLYDSLLNRK